MPINRGAMMDATGKIDAKELRAVRERMRCVFRALQVPPDTPYALRVARKRGEPCFACGGTTRWVSWHGATVCRTCHPPVSRYHVAEWIDEDQ